MSNHNEHISIDSCSECDKNSPQHSTIELFLQIAFEFENITILNDHSLNISWENFQGHIFLSYDFVYDL